MKIQFLGTAAAEGIPALWCSCDNCKRSRMIGGRAVRSRSQALIDGKLLIDFPADTYWHMMKNSIDLLDIDHCLITHSHSDHLYPADIDMIKPGFSNAPSGYKLTLHGTDTMADKLIDTVSPIAEKFGIVAFENIEAFAPQKIGGYIVTALPAIHDPKSGPVFYQIQGEKNVLYAHDTHYFHDDVWAYWEKTKPHFDLVSLDCTNACTPMTYVGHMSFEENIQVKKKMCDMGIADESTLFICNHFSHNGTSVVYDDFVPIAAKEGFLVSYDGMTVNI